MIYFFKVLKYRRHGECGRELSCHLSCSDNWTRCFLSDYTLLFSIKKLATNTGKCNIRKYLTVIYVFICGFCKGIDFITSLSPKI